MVLMHMFSCHETKQRIPLCFIRSIPCRALPRRVLGSFPRYFRFYLMKTDNIHFYKIDNLSPDELNAMRRGASGIWLCGGRIVAKSGRAACAAYRKSRQLGSNARKLRAKP